MYCSYCTNKQTQKMSSLKTYTKSLTLPPTPLSVPDFKLQVECGWYRVGGLLLLGGGGGGRLCCFL